MPNLTFKGSTFTLDPYESVLECLLRNQQFIPFACKAGTCQACLVKAVDCEATPESQKWIKQSLRDQGYTLACQWVPSADVEAALPTLTEFSIPTVLHSLEPLNDDTMKVVVDVTDKAAMFHYFPGQYVTLINPQGIARSYSVANNYEQDHYLEFHISTTSHGIFTHWLFEEAAVGDTMHMRGPYGDCYYSNSSAEDFPIILAGVGTGLAPLYGILNDALSRGHKGDIHLYHGGRSAEKLYLTRELGAIDAEHKNFYYHPCLKEQNGSVEDVVDQTLDLGSLKRTRVYLCGAPDFVHGLRKLIFLKGASSGNIFCDPFLERSVAPTGGTNHN